jgi:HK97 family phage prohead protease
MPPPATLERKQVALDDLALLDTASTGSFGGYASSFGNVDAYGDTIVPGAYAATIPKFLVHGFIGWGHDDRIPVAYLTDAREDEYGLWIEAVFHGTPAAQEARQITAERIAAGKRMGLSIGYWPVKSEEGPNDTRRLLEIDLVETSLVLVPADEAARVAAVKATPDGAPVAAPEDKPFPNEHACRLRDPGGFQPDTFRRVSRTSDGKRYDIIMGRLKGESTMTEQAYRYPKDTWAAGAARAHCDSHDGASFEPASDAAAAPPPDLVYGACGYGTPWPAHLATVETALRTAVDEVHGFYTRALAAANLTSSKEGRRLSTETRAQLTQVLAAEEAFGAAMTVIRQLLAETEPPPKGWDGRLTLREIQSRLRLRGLLAEEEPL